MLEPGNYNGFETLDQAYNNLKADIILGRNLYKSREFIIELLDHCKYGVVENLYSKERENTILKVIERLEILKDICTAKIDDLEHK